MRYAKTNLRSVEDRAVKFGLSETQEAAFREPISAPNKPVSTS